ncbi:hypothetical protein H2248_003763 [Termitomyces sp. 'cryptogamus']|nr:hypothetical protein H2248_003763 [Termitomyces sp. 'cryptogamus']
MSSNTDNGQARSKLSSDFASKRRTSGNRQDFGRSQLPGSSHQVSTRPAQSGAQDSKEGATMKDTFVIQPRPTSATKVFTIGHATAMRPIISHDLSQPSGGPHTTTKADSMSRKLSDVVSSASVGDGKIIMKGTTAAPSYLNVNDIADQSTVSTSVSIEKEAVKNGHSSTPEKVKSGISRSDRSDPADKSIEIAKIPRPPPQKDNVVEGSYKPPTLTSDSEYEIKTKSRSSSRGESADSEPKSSTTLPPLKRSIDLDRSDEGLGSWKKGPIRIPGSSVFNKLFKGSRNSANMTSKTKIGDNDIVIAVMGRVGKEGKRLFIDDVFGDNYDRHAISSPHTHFVVASDPDRSHPGRNIFMVYTTGGKEQKLNEAIRHVSGWLSDTSCDKRKFSGLIYLEDASTAPPTKLSRHALDLLDQCVDRPNIVIATTGWDDDANMEPLENRHKELVEQWRAFVDRGVSVLRLSAPAKASRDVFHTSWDTVKLLLMKHDGKTTTEKRAVWKGKEQKVEDRFLSDPRDTDFVIPVMGPTGAGKSTFINYVAGQNVTIVGHNLKSETQQLQHVVLPHPTESTRRIIIVDTPGFDDTYVADSEILRRISVWLARSYSANMTLAGVIYLHEISQTRMLGTARKNLDMFNKLIGHDATRNVVLATTKWGDIPEAVGIRREEQLKDRHWKGMIDLGATLLSFRDSRESGWTIIQHIIDSAAIQPQSSRYVDSVAIQNELVEVRKMLPETEAGKTLLYTLEELLEMQRQSAAQLRKDESSDEVKAMMQENDQKIRATLSQINDLSGNRLRAWLKKLF